MAVALRMFRRKFPSKFDLSVFDYKRKKEKKNPVTVTLVCTPCQMRNYAVEMSLEDAI